MKSCFLWLRAMTPVHVGAGQTASLIDLPVIREATTGYPFIPGSAMKGALRDDFRLTAARSIYANAAERDATKGWASAIEKADNDEHVVVPLFGRQESAGQLLVGDARLAFLPMRSLEHAFVWVTCPFILWRLNQDLAFAGSSPSIPETAFKPLRDRNGPKALFSGNALHIEDYRFERSPTDPAFDPASLFEGLFPDTYAADDYSNVVIVRDDFFAYLSQRRLPVRMRNRLEPVKKTVVTGALWSEESLPPETLLYTVIAERAARSNSPSVNTALTLFQKNLPGHLQVGGNETVGEGWLALSVHGGNGQ